MTQSAAGAISSSVPHQSDSKSKDSTNSQFISSSGALKLTARNFYFSKDDDTRTGRIFMQNGQIMNRWFFKIMEEL